MAFSEHLYCIVSSNTTENSFVTELQLNADDPIYEGHFPEQSITPGVVQMAIVKELLANHLQVELALLKMNNCKFLAVLNPDLINKVSVCIDYIQVDKSISVKAVIQTPEQVYLKLKATYCLV